MADNLNGLEQLEREIANYRSKFQLSSDILDDLVQVQVGFEELGQKYQNLKNKHQALTEYINKAQTEFAALQAESKSTIDKVVQTQDKLIQCFTNFESATLKNINQALETSNQHFVELADNNDKQLQQSLNDIQKVLTSLQIQFSDTISQVAQAKSNFQQRFDELTLNNNKQIAEQLNETQQAFNSLQTQSKDAVNQITQTQEYLNQRFAKLESTNLEHIEQTQESLNQRFTTLETTVESKWKQFQQQISYEIDLLKQNDEKLKQEFEQQITELIQSLNSEKQAIQSRLESLQSEANSLNKVQEDAARQFVNLEKNTKHTRTIAYTATGLSIIAVIIAVLLSLLQARNEVKYPTVESPQISKPTRQ